MGYGLGYATGYGEDITGLSVIVEIAFATDPGDTPDWTDVSEYLERFTVHRGRADELSPFSAGTAQITLTNEDRRFDPTYEDSPYWPNVVPMRRIRVRATWEGVTYSVFNGYVSNWRQEYAHPEAAWAIVDATDAFKVLGNITLTESVYGSEVEADSPAFWWRLGEESGSTTVLDQIEGKALDAFGAPALGAAGLTNNDPDTALSQADNTSGFSGTGTFVPGAAAGSLRVTLEAIIKTTTASSDETILSFGNAGEGMRFRIRVATGKANFEVSKTVAGNTQGTAMDSGASVNDGQPHHIVAVFDGTLFPANDMLLYVDGVLTSGAWGLGGTLGADQHLAVGNQANGFSSPHAAGLVGTIDEAAVYAANLSSTRITAHSAARATPWQGDTTGERVDRILDAAGWPAADRNIDTGQSTLQSAELGQTALAALQQVEQTEFGALFITGAGLVRFVDRLSLLTAPYTTSQADFGDDGSELEYADITFEYGDQQIFNEARVSRSGGAVQVVGDPTSQIAYMRRSRVVDGLLHQDDSTSRDIASWIVTHYKDPILRVTGMKLEPSAGNEDTHFPQVLGRELLDRVTVIRRPQSVGVAISQESMIQGITHNVTATEWVTEWNLSPAETQVYWIAGVAGFSEAGVTTRAGF